MEDKILEVEETFLIKGRDLVIVGRLEKDAPNFKVGDKIKFYCSDNSEIFSKVSGFEIFTFNSPKSRQEFYKSNKIAFSARSVADKKEVLKGANVFVSKVI